VTDWHTEEQANKQIVGQAYGQTDRGQTDRLIDGGKTDGQADGQTKKHLD
jgi:hypothetical protein